MDDYLCSAHSINILGLNEFYSNWNWSRKYDGFSLLWDGGISTGAPIGKVAWGKPRSYENERTKCTGLWTNKGHIIHAPNWWFVTFPKYVPLQGEAWFLDNRWWSSVCNCSWKNSIMDNRWRQLQFKVYNYKPYELFPGFDLTFLPLGQCLYYKNAIFKERYKRLKELGNMIDLVPQSSVGSFENLINKFKTNTKKENPWEGLMLTNPGAEYQCKRSYNLLKLKPTYDIEVTIIGHNYGTKSNKDILGSLTVKLTWDKKVLSFYGGKQAFIGKEVYFSVGGGISKYQREWDYVKEKWPLGKKITIEFSTVGNNGCIPSASIKRSA